MLGLNSLRRRALPAAFVAWALVGAMLTSGAAAADDTDAVLGEAPQVAVSTDEGNPTPIEAGLWSDTLEPTTIGHQFVYERVTDTSAVHISVIGSVAADDGIDLEVKTSGEPDCGSDEITGGSAAPVAARVSVARDSTDDECMFSKSLRFEVSRTQESLSRDNLPVRIKVVEEARLDNRRDGQEGGALPTPPESDELFVAPRTSDPEAVEPGRGFDDARELTSGTVVATLEPGDVHFYRAPVDWGQTLAAQVEIDPLEPPDAEDFFASGPEVALSVADPMRHVLSSNLGDVDPEVTVDFDDPEAETETAVATTGFGPVVWRDRYESGAAYLPGDHWIIVRVVDDGDESNDVPVPYRLSMEVQGESVDAPVYAGGVDGFLVGADNWSAFASGHVTLDDEEAWLTTRRGAGIGLVVAGLVCLALGVWQVRRPRA